MSDPVIGTPVEVRVPNNAHHGGQVSGGIVLGTPNKADVIWTAHGASTSVNFSAGLVQDDTLGADNTYRIVV